MINSRISFDCVQVMEHTHLIEHSIRKWLETLCTSAASNSMNTASILTTLTEHVSMLVKLMKTVTD